MAEPKVDPLPNSDPRANMVLVRKDGVDIKPSELALFMARNGMSPVKRGVT
jgi:hypothetical protein